VVGRQRFTVGAPALLPDGKYSRQTDQVRACEEELLLGGPTERSDYLKWTGQVLKPEGSDERMFWLAQAFAASGKSEVLSTKRIQ
jgi:hypothetical protein